MGKLNPQVLAGFYRMGAGMRESTGMATSKETITSWAGYAVERFFFIVFLSWSIRFALDSPGAFRTLTQATVLLYTLYFSIDKTSAHAGPAVRLLHGVSVTAAISVVVGYCAAYYTDGQRYGGWYGWEKELVRRGGGAAPSFSTAAASAFVVHGLPPIALLVDLQLQWGKLRRCYRGGRWPTVAWAVGGYLLLGCAWMALARRPGDTTELYMWSPNAFEMLGLEVAGVEMAPGVGNDLMLAIGGSCVAWGVDAWMLTRLLALAETPYDGLML